MLSARQVEPRRFVSALLFTLVLAVAGGGLAWACTPQATLTLKPSSAPAGTSDEVKGENYTKAGRPVRIRWGSFDGPLLATAHPA